MTLYRNHQPECDVITVPVPLLDGWSANGARLVELLLPKIIFTNAIDQLIYLVLVSVKFIDYYQVRFKTFSGVLVVKYKSEMKNT